VIALFFLIFIIYSFFAIILALLTIGLSLNLLNHNFSNILAGSNDHVTVRFKVEFSDPPSRSSGLGFEYCLEAVVFLYYDTS